MNITELREAVRALVPDSISTCVALTVWDFNHTPGRTEVSVKISALNGIPGHCEQVESPTADESLELFRIVVLPKLGIVNAAPALERLAELEAVPETQYVRSFESIASQNSSDPVLSNIEAGVREGLAKAGKDSDA